jgi:2-polyprenyl-6-methoxyphenol hydroxylase-like FAD-dependent oxidoreductase
MLDKNAVVIGGGIGGLSAAVALRRRGWRVTVLERAREFGEIGAGLTLMPNGVRSLEVLGLGSAVRLSGRVDGSGGTRTADGRWLARIDAEALRHMAGGATLRRHDEHGLGEAARRAAASPGTSTPRFGVQQAGPGTARRLAYRQHGGICDTGGHAEPYQVDL